MSLQKYPRVAIIMSTYNGEKYLDAQLDSLLKQTFPNIDIYIRDDGSTDGTIDILRRYAKKYKHIHLNEGENLGFASSFLSTLSNADGYDYYAFCDQDDVWLDFKIQRAVDQLTKYPNNRPLLYGSGYDYYDANLNFLEHSKTPKYLTSFILSTMESFVLGTCMVINQLARELLLRFDTSKICAHDWAAFMLCASMGEIIYDPTPTVKYRRTGNNASPCGYSFSQLQIYRIKKFLIGSELQRITQQNRHFAELFYSELRPVDQEVVSMFMGENTLSKRLRKTFYHRRWRRNLFDEVLLRFVFLTGKM